MKKAILIVSFGTTYTETRIKNITAIKNQVSMLYPDTIIEEAVSSRIVRNHMKHDGSPDESKRAGRNRGCGISNPCNRWHREQSDEKCS